MKTPAIQNDFSYYRRTITRQRMSSTDGFEHLDTREVTNELANHMSLFYAHATPMLKVLSEATTRFVAEVSLLKFWSMWAIISVIWYIVW